MMLAPLEMKLSMADEGPADSFLSIQDVKQGNVSGILDAIYAGNVEWL